MLVVGVVVAAGPGWRPGPPAAVREREMVEAAAPGRARGPLPQADRRATTAAMATRERRGALGMARQTIGSSGSARPPWRAGRWARSPPLRRGIPCPPR